MYEIISAGPRWASSSMANAVAATEDAVDDDGQDGGDGDDEAEEQDDELNALVVPTLPQPPFAEYDD